jgi:hypothetical protein
MKGIAELIANGITREEAMLIAYRVLKLVQN